MHLGSPQFTLVVIIQPKKAWGTPIQKNFGYWWHLFKPSLNFCSERTSTSHFFRNSGNIGMEKITFLLFGAKLTNTLLP
jgi:hypothetical protein